MGRGTVRAAIASYIQGLAIPYVGSVYPARPVIMPEQAYVQTLQAEAIATSANGSSCVIVVNMPDDDRVRQADTGRGAVQDKWTHRVALELFFASTAGKGVEAQQDYDSIADALVIGIRSNATPGGALVVWSAGEFNYGVKHAMDQPFLSPEGEEVLINGAVRFEAIEWIAGSGV